MAPDKVYINNYNGNDTLGNQWHSKPSQSPSVVSNEYIRKDALLEWLEKRLHEVGLAGTIHIIDVIDKLNSM